MKASSSALLFVKLEDGFVVLMGFVWVRCWRGENKEDQEFMRCSSSSRRLVMVRISGYPSVFFVRKEARSRRHRHWSRHHLRDYSLKYSTSTGSEINTSWFSTVQYSTVQYSTVCDIKYNNTVDLSSYSRERERGVNKYVRTYS